MILELLCSAAISQISSGTEIVYKDLGRLTPFGRTVDVYIKNTHGDVPISLGSNGPGTSVAWWIDGEIWKNHDDSQMDFLLNDPANVEWLYNNIPNFSDYQPGDWWACMQDNPNQTLWWQNTSVPRFYYQQPGVDGVFFGEYERSLQEQDYWWADSWLVMNEPWQLSGNNASTFTVQPEIPQFVRKLLEDDRIIFWAGAAPPNEVGTVFCPPPDENGNFGYPWYWSGELMRFKMFGDDRSWESTEFDNHWRIARITGPDYIGIGGTVTYNPPDGVGAYYENTGAEQFYADNSCPSDLNEDGIVGFNDLLQVLSDYSNGRYRVDGFNAILKVLSEWGDCDA